MTARARAACSLAPLGIVLAHLAGSVLAGHAPLSGHAHLVPLGAAAAVLAVCGARWRLRDGVDLRLLVAVQAGGFLTLELAESLAAGSPALVASLPVLLGLLAQAPVALGLRALAPRPGRVGPVVGDAPASPAEVPVGPEQAGRRPSCGAGPRAPPRALGAS